MKRTIAMLICVMLTMLAALPMPAFAEAPEELPPDATPAPRADEFPSRGDADSSFIIQDSGESIRLDFDSSPQYSSVENGAVQASYYGYAADGVTLYELYIIFPDSAKPGMVITPEYAAMTKEESSVVLIVSDNDRERYFFSSVMDGAVYPIGSSYAITIEAVEGDGKSVSYSGTLSATLIALNMVSGEVDETFSIEQTPFRFTVNGAEQDRHADPLPTPAPDDMKKV